MDNDLKQKATAMMAAAATAATETRVQKLAKMMEARRDEFGEVIRNQITPQRFIRLVFGAFRKNPKLIECTDISIVSALMDCAAIGLEPNTPLGEAWIIPYRNKRSGVVECQLQIGYQGYLRLLYDSGHIRDVTAKEVCANDKFIYEEGTTKSVLHVCATSGRGPVLGYYAIIRTTDGGEYIEYMTTDEIAQTEARSKSRDEGPWQTDRDMMARKTVLKKCMKYAPKFTPQVRELIKHEENFEPVEPVEPVEAVEAVE